MKYLKKSVIFMLILAGLLTAHASVKAVEAADDTGTQGVGQTTQTDDVGGDTETELTWTDFSNAKLELVNNNGQYFIDLKGITPISGHRYYLYFLTDRNEPSIEKIKEMDEDASAKKYRKIFSANTSFLRTSAEINDAYVENKDFYMAIVEKQVKVDEFEKVGKYGVKLERLEIPKYSDAFTKTVVGKNVTQILTHFPMEDKGAQRKMTIKIGHITDNEILKKIKNKDKSGFQDLLAYAKSNSAIYNEKVNASSYGSKMGYAGSSAVSIDIGDKIADGAYYFLYVEADNENGKYISSEAVTLAKGFNKVGSWSLSFYGSDDFNMDEFTGGTDVTPSPNPTDKPAPTQAPDNKDDSTMKGKLPQTGVNMALGLVGFGAVLIAGESYRRYRKNKI